MSEFDKEAERERLREKYASEEEDRETTERMSQLLLQGATMTNRHCDTCSSPIFRYQGQEFCPTCQAEAQETTQGQAETGAVETDEGETQHANQQPATQPPQTRTQDTVGDTAQNAETAPALREGSQPVLPSDDADLGDATDALTATIATLAARAERSDDPRRAKEFLEAAHEAADTLATLHR